MVYVVYTEPHNGTKTRIFGVYESEYVAESKRLKLAKIHTTRVYVEQYDLDDSSNIPIVIPVVIESLQPSSKSDQLSFGCPAGYNLNTTRIKDVQSALDDSYYDDEFVILEVTTKTELGTTNVQYFTYSITLENGFKKNLFRDFNITTITPAKGTNHGPIIQFVKK